MTMLPLCCPSLAPIPNQHKTPTADKVPKKDPLELAHGKNKPNVNSPRMGPLMIPAIVKDACDSKKRDD